MATYYLIEKSAHDDHYLRFVERSEAIDFLRTFNALNIYLFDTETKSCEPVIEDLARELLDQLVSDGHDFLDEGGLDPTPKCLEELVPYDLEDVIAKAKENEALGSDLQQHGTWHGATA